MKKRSLFYLVCVFTFWVIVDAGDSFALDKSELAVNDYTYSCWLNGWRKNTNDCSADIFGIETSHYGFTLDIADLNRVGLGLLNNPASYEQALKHKAENLKKIPLAQLMIEIEVEGVRYRAKTCKAGLDKGAKHLASVRLWESGRYVQHYDFQGIDFRNAKGEKLACDATLDVVAWPKSLTFNLDVSPAQSYKNTVMRLGLKSKAGNWNQEVKVEKSWEQDERKSISLTCDISSAGKVSPATITVNTENGQRIPVRFDKSKNCYVASVKRLKRNWRTGYTDIRNYDDFKVTVSGSGSGSTVPFLLDMRPPANITGLCLILCDENRRPTGIPVQLSKNWHHQSMGAYLMAYAMLPAEKSTTYLLRVAYGFYGTLPSASHAQLSLVGYSDKGGNGRWDQLAIGCWGETICFDMDMSLVDVVITDIRMLMARQGINGKKWSWTEAGWGGDWLNIQDAGQKKYFWTDLKTAYLSQGPCLTNVKYEGYYGANREVDFKSQIQTLRTDDYSRSFQKFSYTFTRDVSPQKMWLFKLGRTHYYHTPKVAYGNGEGYLAEKDASNTLKSGHLVVDNVTLTGTDPYWVALPDATFTRNNKPNGYRALVIRDYKVVSGGKTYTNPTISVPVYKANPTNLDIELLPPVGVSQFSKGDRIELDLELITLPREADDYYGPNEAFRKHLTENPTSWKTTYREAIGNDLKVNVSGGKMLQNYPVVVQVEKPEVTVTIKGGIGAVPISFKGLKSNNGYCLYQVVNGKQKPFDQSVHGNDFWQTDYDPAANSYTITYNLPLDELDESTWFFSQEQETPYVIVHLDRGSSGRQGLAPVVIGSDMEVSALAFAVGDIQQALAKQGDKSEVVDFSQLSEKSGQNKIVIGLSDDKALLKRLQAAGGKSLGQLSPEGYALCLTRQGDQFTAWAIGADVTGAMYAGLAVAEAIGHSGLAGIHEADCKPYIAKRGLKINVPLDARTPAYADCGDAAQQNMAVMWELDFWKAHLDQMARCRYNTITMWNAHPFPSMVKVPDYPDVALDDVKIADIDWREWFPKYAGSGGANGVTKEILENLKTIKKISIKEKIAFWREVMQYGQDRGIEFHIITWNIFTWGAEGKYGITPEVDNEVTIDYLRKSVQALFETYPLLAGIGTTAGERMPRLTPDQKENWLWKTYGLGVMDAKKDFPGRKIRFIHRYWMSKIPEITKHFDEFDDDIQFDFSYKYVKARLYAHTDPPFVDKILEGAPADTKWWWNLRNDDIFYFRWGDPDYVREFFNNFPPADQTEGFHMGSDGYVWGREFVSNDPDSPRQLEIDKHWYKFMLWGRLGYDPSLSNDFFKQAILHRFPTERVDVLFDAWARASKIIPAINRFHWHDWDFQWAVEACQGRNGYHAITDKCWKPGGVKVADEIQDHAENVLKQLPGLKNSRTANNAWRETVLDLEAMSYLGLYYAEKIRAADTKDKQPELAVKHLEKAAEHWKRYAEIGKKQYKSQLLSKGGWADWEQGYENALKDISLVKDK